jgi:tripartite ATP-independent transporter DctP family solute receptor
MRRTTPRGRLARLSALAAGAMLLVACGGGFEGSEKTGGGGNGGGAEASGPELSDPPAIEGDIVSDGDEHSIKFGIGLSPGSPQHLSVEYFRDILDHRTDGRLTVEIFPDSQVGDDNQMMSALQSGTLEMTYPSTSPAASIVPELGLFDLPFLFPTPEAADEVLDGETGQGMLDAFDGTGIKALAFAENGYRQLTNSNGPVSAPEDVDGLAIRVMENPIQVDIWKALGANPTSMAFGEVFSALEQGVVDGQENPWNTILTSKFYEVQDFASETRHVYTPFIIMIGEKFFDGLSPEDQEIVQEAATAAAGYERTLSREFNDYAKQQLIDRGMEITDLTDEQVKAFQEATQPVYDKWAPKLGADLVARVQEQAQG